jgi:NitT/TauT family transport system substrate-binding protein
MKKTGLIILLCMIVYLTGISHGADELLKVSLLPQWIPQAQFAGYMVAVEKGYYRQAGLDLTLLRGGPDSPPFDLLSKGEVTFCTGWLSTGMQQRGLGTPVVNIAQIIQRSALMLIAKKESGINSPESLQGKRLALWEGDFRIQPLAFFQRNNLSVTIVPLYAGTNLLLKGAVDATTAMWYNEYHTILNSGFNPDELTVIFFSDHGLNFPEDGIYCLEKTYLSNPGLCARMVEATLRGWIYAFEHQDEALDIVIKYAEAAHTGTNRAHQKWMLARMKDIILPDGDKGRLGKLSQEDYDRVAAVLKDQEFIVVAPPFSEFYRGPK